MSVSFTVRTVPAGETYAFPVAHLDEINLNDGNARLVLDLLGLHEPDTGAPMMWGLCRAGEFAERVAVAEATDPGSGRAGFDDGRWHEIGADGAHIRGRLSELSELARAARDLPDAVVGWS